MGRPTFGDFQGSTLVELLRWRNRYQPDYLAYKYLADGEVDEIDITYGELDQRARSIGAYLQRETAVGERALLLYPPGIDYIAAFFGCLYAGVVAVPAYPPRMNRPSPRLEAIVADAQARIALTTGPILKNIERRFEHSPTLASLLWFNTDKVPDMLAGDWQDPDVSDEYLAFLQYTSGSTSAPKGVKVSHGNLIHNLAMIRHGLQLATNDTSVFWLPSYHDMGLIGGVLGSMSVCGTAYLMPPAAFLQRPVRWLRVISRYRANITGGPNFAYQMCVDKVSPEQLETLDLSNLKVTFCGAETIRKDTLKAFADKFSPYGFNPQSFYPCYGLAEGTLIVSGGDGPSALVSKSFQTASLLDNRAVPSKGDKEPSSTIVNCGHALLDQEIRIADPHTLTSRKDGEVGEIWVSGPSVAQGYWARQELSRSTFQAYIANTGDGPFLRTGDLGFLHEGELFVTGRVKDLIIIRGRNHYPNDIELTVEGCHRAIEPGSGAAFSIDVDGEEALVIVHELARRHRRENSEEIIAAVRRAVSEVHDLQVYALVLLKPYSIPKTSSGKVRRHACREAFLTGTLKVLGEWRATTKRGQQPAVESSVGIIGSEDKSQIPDRTTSEIEQWLLTRLAQEPNISPSDIDLHQPFSSYGVDSLQVVSISGDMETWLGRRLSPTLAWDYPTINELATYLANGTLDRGDVQQQSTIHPEMKRTPEPIAVIGLACRFPGASDTGAFWHLLRDGVDAIGEVPADRWDIEALYDPDGNSGKMMSRWGGFIDGVDEFDPHFFGISPREAARMDPQQRLFLESAWVALENAGIAPSALSGSATGVFVGISSYDYSRLQFSHLDIIDAYAGTGNAHSIAANRLSYMLDLRGPSFAVDTACSSSLVAAHLAMRSLRDGESDLAVAGGVNLLLAPELTIALSQARMMSADGRCKTFDSRADGFVRGEGCGVVILKRLSDALRDGDNIVALLRGSAVNQDGRSNGLTAPNGLAQQSVIREALDNAGLDPSDIDYVEAHGTGTSLGDPIEVHSLRAVIEDGRSQDQTCYLGSVKTNIGHLESAAGIAGLIKVILALSHEEIPPHLHFTELNPYIDLDGSSLTIATESQPWPRNERPRLAGVSSFGFGGTNAHLIVSDSTISRTGDRVTKAATLDSGPEESPVALERSHHILALSAKDETALHELASRYLALLQVPSGSQNGAQMESDISDQELANICFTAATGRTHFKHRLAIAAAGVEQFRDDLVRFASSASSPATDKSSGEQRVAFLFTGQGSQYDNMGRQLYESQLTFRAAIDRCAQILEEHLDIPLVRLLYPGNMVEPSAGTSLTQDPTENQIPSDSSDGDGLFKDGISLNDTAYTQPALFAVEYALAELWRSWGIQPDVLMGHSVGEYVAACIAGVFSLEDALMLVATRGRMMQALDKNGLMAVVFANEQLLRALLEPYADKVNIAAINGPENIVISGEFNAVKEILAKLAEEGIEGRLLDVSHAFHSPLMEPMLEEFERIANQIEYSAPRLPMVLNVDGRLLTDGEILDATYWRRQIRRPVQFSQGIRELEAMQVSSYLELGPQPHLAGMGKACLPKSKAAWLPSLRKGQDDWQVMLRSLGILYVSGAAIDWSGFDKDYPRRKVTLPNYPFTRQRHWLDVTPAVTTVPEANSTADVNTHPYLGRRLRTAMPIYESQFDPADVADLPATYREMILAVATDLLGPGQHQLQRLTISEARLTTGRTIWQTIVTHDGEENLDLQILSLSETVSEWVLQASSQVQKGDPPVKDPLPVDGTGSHEDKISKSKELLEDYLLTETARVLGMNPSRLDVNTPLDMLGMDSLMAIELRNTIESELGLTLPVVNFLRGPTVSDLVLQLKNIAQESNTNAAVIRPVSGSDEAFPLPPGQQAMWFLQQLMPENMSLNVSGAAELSGQVDVSALQEALRKLIKRHPMLRAIITPVSGKPMLKVRPEVESFFYELEASEWDQEQVQAYLVEQAHAPFDLENGPLLRLLILHRLHAKSILLLSVNHTVADFWSMSLIVQELYLLYEAELRGVRAPLPPLELQYSDYAQWLMEMLSSPEGIRLQDYWLSHLSGELPLLNLPTDRPRPANQTYHGDSVIHYLDPDLTRKLKELGQGIGATLYMTLLASFQVLLHRYTGQQDLLLGTVLSGRDRPEIAGQVGYYLNPVVMRADFSGDPSFKDFLEKVRTLVLAAYEHQYYPLSLLAEQLQIERDPSRPPLFETMFIMQKAQLFEEHGLSAFALGIPGARLELSDLVLESMSLGSVPSQFDLTLMAAELENGLFTSLHYNKDLFDEATVERMLAHFEVLVRGIVAGPDKSVSSLPYLTRAENQQLLVEWNETGSTKDGDLLTHQLVEAQTYRTPDAVAVIHDGEQLTYQEMNRRANQLAHYLRERGVGPEVLVGIGLERSADMVVALLGVLKAGGAYVPLDPAFPNKRLSFMLSDAQPAVLLTQEKLLEIEKWDNPDGMWSVVSLDTEWPTISQYSEENPENLCKSENLAYVIYTSGSTGRPKGVQISHGSLSNFLATMAQRPGMTKSDILLAVTTLSFDIAGLELFLPLTVGAQVEVVSRDVAVDGSRLREALALSKATVMQATPSTWQMLLDAGWQGNEGLKILCGGEALGRELANRLMASCSELWNMYGPTETTIWSAIYLVTDGSGPVPIGRPIGNTQIYILDRTMQPVPTGVVGDLYIGGNGVSRGYLKRPQLTAARFVQNPFGGDRQNAKHELPAEALLYKSGDLAKYLNDGNIVFLGRDDHQVKVSGYRIELGDIETMLGKHPSVQRNVVMAREDTPGDKRLVAYLQIESDQSLPSIGALQSHLSALLPEYMIPSIFVEIDAMPLTPNGKVDRKSLPVPEHKRSLLTAEYVAPRSALEQELCDLSCGVLGLEEVGVLDSFFELGANSLLAAKLIYQIQEKYQVRVPLRSLFSEPTVSGLATAIELAQSANEDPQSRLTLFNTMTTDKLEAEGILDPNISAGGRTYKQIEDPDHVFLTGASGFVGGFMLSDLLQYTDAIVHCLIRSRDENEGAQRLQQNLERYGLWQDEFRQRIRIIPGDLSQKRLGLTETRFKELAGTVKAIYHAGAMVNLVYPYEAHKAANVTGTQEILLLASLNLLKPVHFVSTLSVFHQGDQRDDRVFYEKDDLVGIGAPFGGYAQSKWVAERMVLAARDRGMPVAIYRPGLVTGHSKTGAWNTDDMMSTLVLASQAIGSIPSLDVMVDLVPVDYVSKAIITLSKQSESPNQIFHLANQHPLAFQDLLGWINGSGDRLEVVSFEEWRDKLVSMMPVLGANGAAAFVPLLEDISLSHVFMPSIDCSNTIAELSGTGINCPPVNGELLDVYRTYLNGQGTKLLVNE